MTTEELAKIIGVSRTTLSKVINGAPGVAPKTEKKIQKYIEMYHFVPNSKARSLVGKEEPIIGLFSAFSRDVAGERTKITSHFATEIINLVVYSAQERGYKTLVTLTDRKDGLTEIEHILYSKLVRGAILLGYDTGSRKIRELSEKGYPMVLVNQERDSYLDNVAVINMDDYLSAYFAIEELVRKGHKNILYLGCNKLRLPAIRRHEGVASAVKKLGSQIDKLTEIDGDFNENTAYEAVFKIYSDATAGKPTGIFSANDVMAIGAMNALKELGYNVPRDVSIIGFDDISISKYLTPGLTTMRCDFEEIASVCVEAIVNLIEKKETPRHVEIPVEYIQRETLAAPGNTYLI